jgi:hypothetical protein
MARLKTRQEVEAWRWRLGRQRQELQDRYRDMVARWEAGEDVSAEAAQWQADVKTYNREHSEAWIIYDWELGPRDGDWERYLFDHEAD